MDFDTWLEADIRRFLDHEVRPDAKVDVARFEDTALLYANTDWRAEITRRLKNDDDLGAKQLFAQLRLRYQQTPPGHEEERKHLYEVLQDCYVAIANHVLESYRTRELLKHMEGGPEDIFDSSVKPIDLTAQSILAERPQTAVPDFAPLTKSGLAAVTKADDFSLPIRDADAFSFEPSSLLKTAAAINEQLNAKEPSQKKIPVATRAVPQDDAPTQAAFAEALALVRMDSLHARQKLERLLEGVLSSGLRTKIEQLLAALAAHDDVPTLLRETNTGIIVLLRLARQHDPAASSTIATLRTRIDDFRKGHPQAPHEQLDALAHRIDVIERLFDIPKAAAVASAVAGAMTAIAPVPASAPQKVFAPPLPPASVSTPSRVSILSSPSASQPSTPKPLLRTEPGLKPTPNGDPASIVKAEPKRELKPEPKTEQRLSVPTPSSSPSSEQRPEIDLVRARERAAQHGRFVHHMREALIAIAGLARTRDEHARTGFAALRDEVAEYAQTYPTLGEPLLSELARFERVYLNETNHVSGESSTLAQRKARVTAIIPYVRAVSVAAHAHDRVATTSALDALERFATRSLPDTERTMTLRVVSTLRTRIGGT